MAKWIHKVGKRYVDLGNGYRQTWTPNTRRNRAMIRRNAMELRDAFPAWATNTQALVDAVDKRKRGPR